MGLPHAIAPIPLPPRSGEGEDGGFRAYFERSNETPLLPLPLLGEGVKQ